jgi:hypothetical protein
MSNIGGNIIGRYIMKTNLWNSGQDPLWWTLLIPSKRSSTLSENMMTNTLYRQLFVRKETRRCQSTLTSSIPYAQIWVSETLRKTWLCSTTVGIIGFEQHLVRDRTYLGGLC